MCVRCKSFFRRNNVDYVIGGRLLQCYKQSRYKNADVPCVLVVSPNSQTSRFLAGKCSTLLEPRHCFTTNNNIHNPVNAPSKVAASDVDSKPGTAVTKAKKFKAAPFKKSKKTKEKGEGDNEEARAGQSKKHISPTGTPLKMKTKLETRNMAS